MSLLCSVIACHTSFDFKSFLCLGGLLLNGLRYPQVGATRARLENGILLECRKLLENAVTPACQLHAILLGGGLFTSLPLSTA